MSLKIAGYLFTGPYDLADTVLRANQKPSVFVLVSREGKSYDPVFRLIEVADTAGQRVEFATHPERARWEAAAEGELGVYFFRPDAAEPEATEVRHNLVAEIMRLHRPPHGIVKVDGVG